MEKWKLSKAEVDLLYAALVRYDGPSLCEDWERDMQKGLTAALDKLRQELVERRN